MHLLERDRLETGNFLEHRCIGPEGEITRCLIREPRVGVVLLDHHSMTCPECLACFIEHIPIAGLHPVDPVIEVDTAILRVMIRTPPLVVVEIIETNPVAEHTGFWRVSTTPPSCETVSPRAPALY